jgi:hypothetical protein
LVIIRSAIPFCIRKYDENRDFERCSGIYSCTGIYFCNLGLFLDFV